MIIIATIRPLAMLLVLILVLSGCALIDSAEGKWQLGDSKTREADNMLMLFVPGGEFSMGIDHIGMRYALDLCRQVKGTVGAGVCQGTSFANEMPTHPVSLESFWIDRTEVTNQQYGLCVEEDGCTPPAEPGSFTRDEYFYGEEFSDYPVVWITRDQAAAYCSWAGGRLPSEAEWEYAARGPENRTFPWGDEFDPSLANYCDASCAFGVIDPTYDDGFPETAPVGSFPAGVSWCGALDMAGNVREWVADWFQDDYYGLSPEHNPQGPESGEVRVVRGGSWYDLVADVRVARRKPMGPSYPSPLIGFRCARSASEP